MGYIECIINYRKNEGLMNNIIYYINFVIYEIYHTEKISTKLIINVFPKLNLATFEIISKTCFTHIEYITFAEMYNALEFL